ncbi:hypothetical protein Pan97_07760 [Bremerella volcania]|uniref:(Na+)-NQR maturation NqrM n=1 Tax=Bremerella volcania TaxID=2527984 RepID=A0A518C3H4_9BACT|nr:hypothetical protein [Bremerella volcania]QDU73776.1 hypothetical protein Pan97_07760 [Bremerella volcania]
MLIVLLITIGVFAIVLAGMAIGVILSNREIKGSCGGLNKFKDSVGNPICDACSNPSPSCSRIPEKERCQEPTDCADHDVEDEVTNQVH